jgi:glutathione S-transferase
MSRTELKPIILYGGVVSPNPFKVAIILEELGIPFYRESVPLTEVKKPAYEAINPNGRLPAIKDPNTGITLWETGAIIEYLITEYDSDHKLSFQNRTSTDYAAKQWLHFQTSGQGPYYGQGFWFKAYHPERLPSAIERYVNEIRRVSGVLDGWLEKREYLVGDKCSYADLAFVPWQLSVPHIIDDAYDPRKEFPNLQNWLDRLTERPAVLKIKKEREETLAKMGIKT